MQALLVRILSDFMPRCALFPFQFEEHIFAGHRILDCQLLSFSTLKILRLPSRFHYFSWETNNKFNYCSHEGNVFFLQLYVCMILSLVFIYYECD